VGILWVFSHGVILHLTRGILYGCFPTVFEISGNLYIFFKVRTGLACDELLKMQSTKSQKVSIPGFNIWIPVKSSLLHGALRIAKIRKDISIYDFIIELIDMGSNTNLTDAGEGSILNKKNNSCKNRNFVKRQDFCS